MDKTRINNRQMGFMLFIMRSTIIIAFLPVLTSADALQDAWASAFVILISSLVITAAVAGLSQRFPQQTIVDYSQKLCGNWLGKLLG
ncbi:MAG: GerAB/ArcD/ProY family transporter, partial [Bacillota bacterium]